MTPTDLPLEDPAETPGPEPTNPETAPAINPLRCPLLILGECSRADLPLYEAYYDQVYRRGPIRDRWGRRVIFPAGAAEHICTANQKYGQDPNDPRWWRSDRAKRLPWILVALTHPHSVLKENKERQNWNYLLAMQADEGAGLARNYFQVVVHPRNGGTEVRLVTAYDHLTPDQWSSAMRMKSVPPPGNWRPGPGNASRGGRY